ncbi:MAG: site-specific integrase, partial [Bradyrhizobium sp.]|nr:site-specific integrase [Bradyrhizobium sp.]
WTYQDAREYERAVIAQIRDLARGRQPQRLITDAMARWLTDHVPGLRSARKTRNHARRLFPFIEGRRIEEIPEVWAEIKATLRGYAPATVNHLGRILRQLGNMAWREWRWIDHPPSLHLLPETPRERFLTVREVDALADACGDPRASGYVLLAAYTGIRRGHLLRLTRHDVEDGFILLDRSGKTRRLQRIPLHPRVEALAARLPLGIGDRQLREAWALARAQTGIQCRWHDLRHTCASWLVQAGVPIYTVAEILGHSNVQVTKRYAHLAPQHLQDAIEKLA